MRTATLIVLLVVGMAVLCSGCVSVEDQEKIDTLYREEKALWTERIRAVDALLAEKKELRDRLKISIAEIRTEVDSGTITYDKSKTFIASIRADIEDTISDVDNEVGAVKERFNESRERIRTDVGDLRAKGNSKVDLVFAGLLSLLTGGGTLGAVRLWRGGVNSRNGNIGAT